MPTSDALATSATIDPASGGTITSRDGFEIAFPANAVRGTTVATYTRLSGPRQPLPNGSVALRSFTLEARTRDGQPVTHFQAPYTMAITYTGEDLSTRGIAESTLLVAFWDGSRWVSVPRQVDTENNRVTVVLDHFTEFVLAAGGEQRLFLPQIIR